jgi:LysM repeat protein
MGDRRLRTKKSENEVRTMPKHAFKRPATTRLRSARGALVVGTFAALSCAALSGTAHAAAPETATASAGTTPHTTTAAKSPRTYTVKPGDTLIHIARSQRVRAGWRAIAHLNRIESPYIIHPGQVLKLPTWHHARPGSATASSSSSTASASTASATSTTKSSGTTATQAAVTTSTATYTDDLDGWIKHSLAIMAQDGIPGTYNGIYRNIMRESSGNPNAINLWDSNAAAGTPSIGLLQVIQPTFDAYHVAGTSENIYDPVANITAACNYAYHVYGSIDNVNGPY